MAEYIDRDGVMQKFADRVWLSNHSDFSTTPTWNQAVQIVEDFPAADVRPVVLCKDCKHNKGARVWRFLDLDDVTADCSAGHGYPPMDWFCADGEKREES